MSDKAGFMYKSIVLCLAVLVFFGAPDLLAAEKLRCSICSKRIHGKYFKGFDGNSYCGKKCFNKSLPRCKNCKKICHGKVLKVKTFFYCSIAVTADHHSAYGFAGGGLWRQIPARCSENIAENR